MSWTMILSEAVKEHTHRGVEDPEIGYDVREVIPKVQLNDGQARNRAFVDSICEDGTLSGILRVPDTIGDITIVADLRARLVTTSTSFVAPRDRGGRARITWLTRQLRDSEPSLIVETYARGARTATIATLAQLLEDPRVGLGESKKDPVRFRVLRRSEMGQGRRSTRKPGFIEGTLDAVTAFYGEVHQNLRAVTPPAPQLDRRPEPESEKTVASSGQH